MKGKLAQETDEVIKEASKRYGNNWTGIEMYQFEENGGNPSKEVVDPHYKPE